jgi:hypothetical protein
LIVAFGPPSSFVSISFSIHILDKLSDMSLRVVASAVCRVHGRRGMCLSAVALQQKVAADPIQQLFVNKVREYAQKKKSSGGKLVTLNITFKVKTKR